MKEAGEWERKQIRGKEGDSQYILSKRSTVHCSTRDHTVIHSLPYQVIAEYKIR